MKNIFRKDIDPQCAYCEHGTVTANKDTVICKKQGAVMQSFSKCKKFKYDPLKREPAKRPVLPETEAVNIDEL